MQITSETIGLLCAISTGRSTYAVIVLTFVLLFLMTFTGFLVACERWGVGGLWVLAVVCRHERGGHMPCPTELASPGSRAGSLPTARCSHPRLLPLDIQDLLSHLCLHCTCVRRCLVLAASCVEFVRPAAGARLVAPAQPAFEPPAAYLPPSPLPPLQWCRTSSLATHFTMPTIRRCRGRTSSPAKWTMACHVGGLRTPAAAAMACRFPTHLPLNHGCLPPPPQHTHTTFPPSPT